MTESLGAHFFSCLVLRKWFKWLQLTSWFLNTSAAKTSTFFLKMKTMWAEAVLAPGLWIAGFLNFSISVGAKPLLLDKCLLESLTKFCSQISVSDSTKCAVWDTEAQRDPLAFHSITCFKTHPSMLCHFPSTQLNVSVPLFQCCMVVSTIISIPQPNIFVDPAPPLIAGLCFTALGFRAVRTFS